MRIRIKFRKYGNMRFVGHLDLMRYFQRAMRRAAIDLAYTEGFNPHPILSFALPLGIGLTSDGEYMDLTVQSTQSSQDAIRALNREMVEGVEVTEYVLLPEDCKKAMASVAAADYILTFRHTEDFTQSEIAAGILDYYSGRDAIEVTKKTKKSERVLDLKPLIYRIEPYCNDREDQAGFSLRLSAGSVDNIRPELVIEDLYRFIGRVYDPFNLAIHRLELYEESPEGFLPLYKAGETIV